MTNRPSTSPIGCTASARWPRQGRRDRSIRVARAERARSVHRRRHEPPAGVSRRRRRCPHALSHSFSLRCNGSLGCLCVCVCAAGGRRRMAWPYSSEKRTTGAPNLTRGELPFHLRTFRISACHRPAYKWTRGRLSRLTESGRHSLSSGNRSRDE